MLRLGEANEDDALVDDTVSSTTGVTTCTTTTRLGDGVQLVEEENTGCGCSGLVKDVSDVGFRFTEPHGEQFRALQADRQQSVICQEGMRDASSP